MSLGAANTTNGTHYTCELTLFAYVYVVLVQVVRVVKCVQCGQFISLPIMDPIPRINSILSPRLQVPLEIPVQERHTDPKIFTSVVLEIVGSPVLGV